MCRRYLWCIYFHSVLGLKAEIQVLVTENSDLSNTITQLNSSLSEQKVHVHVHKLYTHVDMNNHVQRKNEKTETRERGTNCKHVQHL